MMTTAIRATLASLASGTLSHSDHPPNGSLLVIQANAVIENTVAKIKYNTNSSIEVKSYFLNKNIIFYPNIKIY